MRRTGGRLACLVLLVAATPAGAQTSVPADPSCAVVVDALKAMSVAPHYHWRMSVTAPSRRRPLEREQIVIDDTVYMTPDEGRWMKQRMPAAARAARLAGELANAPLQDCQLVERENLDGVPADAYTYFQTNTGLAESEPASKKKRIWIGATDKLPHLLKADDGPASVTTRIDYDSVPAPIS